jgi:amino acid transporter
VIAALTAVSFARLARTFPESGGTYTYAKKVLSVEIAFSVGWVVWFASIVAAVLYALGFAAFATEAAARLLALVAVEAPWIRASLPRLVVALAATAVASAPLLVRAAGGAQWATIGKLIVFAVLIAGGAVA